MPHKMSTRMSLPQPERHGDVMQAWEQFLVHGTCSGLPVRTLIEESWQRCVTQGVDPVRDHAPQHHSEDSLMRRRSGVPDLVEAAGTVCRQARNYLSESGTIMVVTDPGGLILHAEGDPWTIDAAQEISLIPGGEWKEEVAGTNAIGTALEARSPVQVHGAEHFCEGIKKWTCAATVIEDPFDRRILGVVDISGLRSTYDPHCIALAVSTAAGIQEQILKSAMEKRVNLLDRVFRRFAQWNQEALILFDDRGRLIKASDNAAAALTHQQLTDGGVEAEIARLNDNQLVDSQGRALSSVSSSWLEPVYEGSQRLGTLLSVPVAGGADKPRRGISGPSRQESPSFAKVRDLCPSLDSIASKAARLAQYNVPVLIRGETGVGKELMAGALHELSACANGPFVALNCGALSKDLLASELFGYGPGAFTGANKGGMPGKFEAADGGTLFLDEIGEMPLDLQPILLRVLQEGEFYRLGETIPRKPKFRLLAATNHELEQDVAHGLFRSDLYYRLAVVSLTLPPLRERSMDISTLARYHVEAVAERYGLAGKEVSAELEDALASLPWPGNVRELRNVIEGMILMSDGGTLTVDDLPAEYASQLTGSAVDGSAGSTSALKDMEHHAICQAISDADGNMREAARALGIARSTLYDKVKRFGIGRSSV